jgi:hypothetical protein
MELPHGRLRAVLVAGKIPVTDQALIVLRAGLSQIGHGYYIAKFISSKVKIDTNLKQDLSRLHAACRTFVDILDADMSAAYQIEAILSDPWYGSEVPRLVEEVRSLSSRIETAIAMAAQDKSLKQRKENPETWFFLAVHDLFSTMAANPKPGIAGPLHRFTKCCAALIDAAMVVPESENSFQKRLTAALARRTGKFNVFPKIIFPGKKAYQYKTIFPLDFSNGDPSSS